VLLNVLVRRELRGREFVEFWRETAGLFTKQQLRQKLALCRFRVQPLAWDEKKKSVVQAKISVSSFCDTPITPILTHSLLLSFTSRKTYRTGSLYYISPYSITDITSISSTAKRQIVIIRDKLCFVGKDENEFLLRSRNFLKLVICFVAHGNNRWCWQLLRRPFRFASATQKMFSTPLSRFKISWSVFNKTVPEQI